MNSVFVIICMFFSSISLYAMDGQPLYPTLPSENGRQPDEAKSVDGRSVNAAPRPVAANPALSSMLANLSAVDTSVNVVLEALRADHCDLLTAYDQKKVSEAGQVLRKRNDAAHKAFFDYILKTHHEDENKQQVLSPERDEMRRQLGCDYMKALLGELGAQESKESQKFDDQESGERCGRRVSPLSLLVLSLGVYISYWGATTQNLGCFRFPWRDYPY